MANLKGGRNLILNSPTVLMSGSDGGNGGVAEFKDGYVSIVPIATGNVYANGTIKTSLAMEKGKEYTLSFQVSTHGPTGLYWYPSERYVKSGYIPDTKGEWVDVSFTYTQTDDTRANPSLWGVYGLQPDKEVKYTPPKLEIGSTATPWTPAPEDLGLEYPDQVTHFGTYFKDSDMVTDELIEYPEELKGGRNLLKESGQGFLVKTYYSSGSRMEDGKEALVFESSNNIIYLGHSGYQLVENTKYTFSFWAKASKEMSIGRVYINDENDGFLRNELISRQWERYSFTFNSNSSRNVGVHMYPLINNGDGTYETFYITDWKLEIGSKATPWTPSPEDLGLVYPGHITHFGTYFKESDIFEDSLIGGRNLIPNSKEERFDGSGNEFKQYIDLAPILEKYGLDKTYSLSLEMKSLDPSISNNVQVYMQNGSGTKYDFVNSSVTVTKEFQRFIFEGLTPTLTGMADTRATLAFYGRYDTGNFPIVRNVKLEVGDRATPWTPAPEDLGLEYPPSITHFDTDPIRSNMVTDGVVEFAKDSKGFDLRNKTGLLSGEEIFTDQADDSVVHVKVDGKSYQHAKADSKNLAPNPEHWEYSSGASYDSKTGEITIPVNGVVQFWARWDEKTENARLSMDTVSGGGFLWNTTYYAEDKSTRVYENSNSWTGNGMVPSWSSNPVRTSSTTPVLNSNTKWIRMQLTGNPSYTPSTAKIKNVALKSGSDSSYEPPTPTPDYPIKIHSVNDVDVVSSVGRENILENSSFRDNTSGWSASSDVSKTIKDGYDCYVIEHDAFGKTKTITQSIYEDIEVGKRYIISGWVYTENIQTGPTNPTRMFYIDGYDRDNNWIGLGSTSFPQNSNGWVHVSYITDIVTERYTTGRSLVFFVHTRDITGRVYVRDVKMEAVNSASDRHTAWTPSPEDITESDNHLLIDKINLLLDEPLRSVGDVKDRLFRDSGGLWKVERNVRETEVLTASGIYSSGTTNTFTTFTFALSISSLGYQTSHCSHFINKNGGWDNPTFTHYSDHPSIYNKYFMVENKVLGVDSSDSNEVRLNKVRSWLSNESSKGTPVTLVYKSREPHIETLDQELQDKLNNLRSFQDSNYIYTINNTEGVTEDVKPIIHATFKSEDYGELAKDGLVYPDDITHLTTQVKYGTMVVSELIEGGGAYGNSTTRV